MLKRLQGLRGIAAAAVAISHLAHWSSMHNSTSPNLGILRIGVIGVYVFFAISGFIITYAHKNEIGQAHYFIPYLRKRFFRIYPAYALYGGINLLIAWIGLKNWDVTGHLERTWNETFSAITLLPLAPANPYCSFLAVGWTLYYEVCFYLLFSLLLLHRYLGLCAFVQLVVGCLLRKPLGCEIYIYNNMSLLFVSGALASYWLENHVLSRRLSWTAIIVGLIAVIYASLLYTRIVACHSANADNIADMSAMGGAVLLVLSIAALDLEDSGTSTVIAHTGYLRWLGDISYSMYLGHNICYALLFAIFPLVFASALYWPFAFLFVLAIATCTYRWVEVPSRRLARRLGANGESVAGHQ